MDNGQPTNTYVDSSSLYKKENSNSGTGFLNSITIPTNWNFLLIGILLFLLIFSLIGVNILGIFGEFIVNVVANIKPIIINLLKSIGLVTGTVIDSTGDVVHNITDTVGGGLVELSKGETQSKPQSNPSEMEPQPAGTDNTIQSQKKQKGGGYCLVGNYAGKNGCILIDEYDKCLSGKVFPSRSLCLSEGK